MDDKNSLEHYGILGMRWGGRKGHVTSSTPQSFHRTSEDHDKKESIKTKKIHQMSNAELKSFNERAQLERTYKDLSKTEISTGKKIVNNIINSATKGASDAAMSYVNKKAAKMVEDLIKKATTKVP